MAKTASNQLGICLRIKHVRRIPKVSIFMAVITKKWRKRLKKIWAKMRYIGRVIAWKVYFYQCLWVTKLCAKFGRSWIPGTANTHKSFIVLRCMWKEPAPFVHPTVAVLLVIRSATVGKPKKKKKKKKRGANKFLSRTRPSACPSPPCKKLRRLERGAPGLGRTDTEIFLRRTNIFCCAQMS